VPYAQQIEPSHHNPSEVSYDKGNLLSLLGPATES